MVQGKTLEAAFLMELPHIKFFSIFGGINKLFEYEGDIP